MIRNEISGFAADFVFSKRRSALTSPPPGFEIRVGIHEKWNWKFHNGVRFYRVADFSFSTGIF